MLIIFVQWIVDELIKKQNICYWRDCSMFDLYTWKFSISWMKKKKKKGNSTKKHSRKNCGNRKTWWNGIIANNNLYNCNFFVW